MRILVLAAFSSFAFPALASAQQPVPGAEHKPRAEARPDGGDHARARRLLAVVDVDGDGVISPRELHWAREVLAHADRAQHKEGPEKPGEKGEAKPGETLRERADKNDDGKVGPREHEMAKRAHDRADKNDDGKVGPREREMAKRAHDRADKNDDGKVGPREREMAKPVQPPAKPPAPKR